MRLRVSYVLTTALLAAALGPPARAAVPCPMVVGRPGNAQVKLPRETPVLAELEVRSADLASGATTVLVVVRVRDLGAPDPTTLTGAIWDVLFDLGGAAYTVEARRDARGTYYGSVFQPGRILGGAAVTPDTGANSITWAIPRTWLPELARRDQVFRVRGVLTYLTGSPFTQVTVQQIHADVRYRDRAPACIKAF